MIKESSPQQIALVAPAGPLPLKVSFDSILDKLSELGLDVNCYYNQERNGYLAGDDETRLRYLVAALTGPEDTILCLRGGYGCSRIVPRLIDRLSAIHDLPPKTIIGYSDITYLLLALYSYFPRKYRLIHGPCVADLKRASNETIDSFLSFIHKNEQNKLLLAKHSANMQRYNIEIEQGKQENEILESRILSGNILGGNLTVICSMLGTPYLPNLQDKFVLLEDVGEAPYRLDRSLTQLINAGTFTGVKGFLLGSFTECLDKHPDKLTCHRPEAIEVILEMLTPLGLPIITGLPCGHGEENWGVRLGEF